MREVVPVRLSDQEREQIAGAAARLELTFSGFVRQAALEASARVVEKVSVQAPEPPEREPQSVVIVEPEPKPRHWVDGEPVY